MGHAYPFSIIFLHKNQIPLAWMIAIFSKVFTLFYSPRFVGFKLLSPKYTFLVCPLFWTLNNYLHKMTCHSPKSPPLFIFLCHWSYCLLKSKCSCSFLDYRLCLFFKIQIKFNLFDEIQVHHWIYKAKIKLKKFLVNVSFFQVYSGLLYNEVLQYYSSKWRQFLFIFSHV